MPKQDDLATMYNQLMALSRAAFAAHHFAVAYHALAAAMHGADDLRDEERLAEVQAVAHEQVAWIEANDPTHPLSRQSSAARGALNLWESLQREASTRRMLLEQAREHHLA